jgi:hypothetical protein
MPATLTGKEFSQHVNSKYRVNVDSAEPIELELVEVREKESLPGEQGGLERFSVYFIGPENICLPQATYRLTHERMGAFNLFLVAIAKEKLGFRYEAVFNYYKSP